MGSKKVPELTNPADVKVVKQTKEPLHVSILRENIVDVRQFGHLTEPTEDIVSEGTNPELAKQSKDGPCRTEEHCCRDAQFAGTGPTKKVKTGCGNEVEVAEKSKKPWSQMARELTGQAENEQELYVKTALLKTDRTTEDDLSDGPGASSSRTALLGKVQNLTGPTTVEESASMHVNVYEAFGSGLKSSSSLDITKKIEESVGQGGIGLWGGVVVKDEKNMPCRTKDCCMYPGAQNPNYYPLVPVKPTIPEQILIKTTRDLPGQETPKGAEGEPLILATDTQLQDAGMESRNKDNDYYGYANKKVISNKPPQIECPKTQRTPESDVPYPEAGYQNGKRSSCAEAMSPCECGLTTKLNCPEEQEARAASFGMRNNQQRPGNVRFKDRQRSSCADALAMQGKQKVTPKNVSPQFAKVDDRKRSSCADALANRARQNITRSPYPNVPCDCGLTTKHNCPEEQMAAEYNGLDPCDCGQTIKRNCPEEQGFRRGEPSDSLMDNPKGNEKHLGFFKTTTRNVLKPENFLQMSESEERARKEGMWEEMAMMAYGGNTPGGAESLIKNTIAPQRLADRYGDPNLLNYMSDDPTNGDYLHGYGYGPGRFADSDITDENRSFLQTHIDTSVQCVSALYPFVGEGGGEGGCKFDYIEKYDAETQFDNLSMTSSKFSNYSSYRELLREEMRDVNRPAKWFRRIAKTLLLLNIFFLLCVMGLCAYVVLQYLELEKLLKETENIATTCAAIRGK